jgi:AMMECR1 domain-containing protein
MTARAERKRQAGGAGFPWRALDGPMDPAERAALVRSLRGLLAWQRTLARWPKVTGAPDATPFVSLYRRGELRGCCGSGEGESGERLVRAFLQALGDARHGGARPGDRGDLVAQVSYARKATRVGSVEEAYARIESGTHGVALVREGASAILIPNVARDGGLAARKLIETLARKAGIPVEALDEGALFLFEAEEIVARPEAFDDRTSARASVSLAATWLSRLVREDGYVHSGVDPRARAVTEVGLMHHGRAAVVVRALAEVGRGHAADVARAREWLVSEVRRALRGESVPGWPAERERAAGTIALACMAGAPLERELAGFVGGDPLEGSPWHAAQVVAALGPRAPEPLWRTCLFGLESKPWAPWTAIAAHARGDRATLDRAARVLEASIRVSGPHEGGAGQTEVPEIALTAITIEALAPLVSASARTRAAVARARRFLERWQFRPGRVPAALDPAFAEGAFPLSPIASFARGDVTAHAVLALRASSEG